MSASSKLLRGLVITGAAAAAYQWIVRPWQMRWGAFDEEVHGTMPGDDVVPAPNYEATRAVTIRATPDRIWPWLVQMGHGRAGFYSYDWIDRLLGYMAGPSAEIILPECQNLEQGDEIPIQGMIGFTVHEIEKNKHLVLTPGASPATEMSWSLILQPVDERRTG